ncbi:histo-blood group ABO system transferase 2-like [Panthera tigris]|uniref:histo-blood group ABO system transferase 2-like n=1 Tax=Panthera tigris TaxID=9694 RepID=UPI001C6F711C|nr:histo-blood group ABO system transferase 2-like [Panthera tigris]XP_042833068.1 histo-blood group ABO system transferase 2-like [Panthera tigris]
MMGQLSGQPLDRMSQLQILPRPQTLCNSLPFSVPRLPFKGKPQCCSLCTVISLLITLVWVLLGAGFLNLRNSRLGRQVGASLRAISPSSCARTHSPPLARVIFPEHMHEPLWLAPCLPVLSSLTSPTVNPTSAVHPGVCGRLARVVTLRLCTCYVVCPDRSSVCPLLCVWLFPLVAAICYWATKYPICGVRPSQPLSPHLARSWGRLGSAGQCGPRCVSEVGGELDGPQAVTLSRMVYPQPKVLTPSRKDVLVLTPWLAPTVWEGTFNIDILNEQFRLRNTAIGLTVFAIKKYVAFLELFLQTAEKHFMVGHRVTYYEFTDRPGDVPRVPLGQGRQVVVLEVRSYSRWQDVSMHRVEMISNFSRQRFLHEVDYLVCVDVDMRFRDHVGVEILSPLFGTLHPGFYGAAREAFTYERRPQSQAHIPRDEGDFYYAGGFFGGSVAEVLRLTSACHRAMVVDRAHGIEAVWHDESHLNRYLLDHKPTKVLSPEYLWDEQLLGWPAVVKKLRYVTVPKSHRVIRD